MMFVDDLVVEGAYYALILRSPAARGTLNSVSCPALPAGITLITAAAIPGENSLFDAKMPLLAGKTVSYIGEPVALLTGPDTQALEEYARLCVIDIDEEPPEFSLEAAFEAGAFFAAANYEAGYPPKAKPERFIADDYETGIQEHWYSTPHCAIARFAGDTLTITTASQRPEDVRLSAAAILGMAPERIIIEEGELGIHLDGKVWYPSVIAALAALAAFLTQKTVKLQLTREEDYLFSPKRTPSAIHIQSHIAAGGQLLETSVLIKIGMGAFGIQAQTFLDEAARSLTSVYKTGRLSIEARAVKTNTPPAGPFAGFGSSIMSFALERHISNITDAIDEDGAFWRDVHLQHKLKGRIEDAHPDEDAGSERGARDSHAEPLREKHDLIRAVARESGFHRKWAAYELSRHRPVNDEGRALEQRGAGISFALAAPSSTPESVPAAACVIEITVDRVNYEAKPRGIWLHIAAGTPRDKARAEIITRRSVMAALGWASTEKIKYIDGAISPPLCVLYQLLPASEHPPVHLTFVEEKGAAYCEDRTLEELPFSVIPAAYTQAISQATHYHFKRIPIIGQDVWRVLAIKRQEREKGEVPALMEEGV